MKKKEMETVAQLEASLFVLFTRYRYDNQTKVDEIGRGM
jgi:hypothetical protein